MLAYDAGTGVQLWQSANTLGGWQDGVPTAADGRVFIGANNALVARDGQTGKDLWTYRSPGTSNIPGNATPASAAVTGGTVYMGFPDGNVTALDAQTGSVVWNRQLPGRLDFGGVHSSPAISGDTVYVGSNNGAAYALDRTTGEVVWEREIGAWVSAGPAISGNTVVFGSWDGNLYAFTEQN
jgi:outer membrane protein assembly factor BamB